MEEKLDKSRERLFPRCKEVILNSINTINNVLFKSCQQIMFLILFLCSFLLLFGFKSQFSCWILLDSVSEGFGEYTPEKLKSENVDLCISEISYGEHPIFTLNRVSPVGWSKPVP